MWAQELERSGHGNEISKRMLNAARTREVPDALRKLIDPPHQAGSKENPTSSAPLPEPGGEAVTRRAVFTIEVPTDGVDGTLESLFRDYFEAGQMERDLFRQSGRTPVDLKLVVDPLPIPGRFAIEMTCRGDEVADDLVASLESVLDGWGAARGISFRRVDGKPVAMSEIQDLNARFVAANIKRENAVAFKEAITAAVESAEPLLGRPVRIEAVVESVMVGSVIDESVTEESVTEEAVRVRFFPTAFEDSDSVPQLRFIEDPDTEVMFGLSASGVTVGGTLMGGSGLGALAIGSLVDEGLAKTLTAGDLLGIEGRLERVQEAPAWDGFTRSIPKRPRSKAVAGMVISNAKVELLQATDRPAGEPSEGP